MPKRKDQVPGAGSPEGEDGGETPSTDPEAAFFAKLDERIAASTAAQASAIIEKLDGRIQAASAAQVTEMLKQLPEAVHKMVAAEFETALKQAKAQAEERAQAAAALPAATLETATGQAPASGPVAAAEGQGQPSILSTLLASVLPALAKSALAPETPANSMDGLIKSIAQLGQLSESLDRIRGGGNGGMSANAALAWSKWGYELAKTGTKIPEFPTSKTQEPPTPEV